MKQAFSVFEHGEVFVARHAGPQSLSDQEADRLCLMGEQRPGFCVRGYNSIKLAQYCGLVNLGDRVLEILPKVGEVESKEAGRGVLLRLLSATPDSPLSRHEPVGQTDRRSPLLDVFIRAFFEEVFQLLRGGLLRRYQEEEDECLAIRGAVLLQRQFSALANRPDRVACRYDELSADNTWNRLIKTGLIAVRSSIYSADLQRWWFELMVEFDEVSDEPNARELIPNLFYDRQGKRYRPAIEWVERILNLLSPDLRAGQTSAPGLLFDMNRLFESFVGQRLEPWAWDRGWKLERQNTDLHLAKVLGSPAKKAFNIRPDFIFKQRGQVVAIADAKWKRPSISTSGYVMPHEKDMYQLNAYASVFACDQLAIIYPSSEALEHSHETVLALTRKQEFKPKISICGIKVDEDQEPEGPPMTPLPSWNSASH